MTRKITLLVFFAFITAIGIYVVKQIPVKQKYEDLRNALESPVLEKRPIHLKETGFIGDVMDTWTVHIEECPDEVLTDVFELTECEPNVQGLVSLYTHEIPPYSFVNAKRNKKELVIASTLSMIVPQTKDNCVYHMNGLAYLMLNDQMVEVFRDSDSGVKHTVYIKPKQTEQVAAPDG